MASMIQSLFALLVTFVSLKSTLCFNYQTTTPTRYTIDKRNFKDIIPASLPIVFRLGSGVFCSGFNISIGAETEANKDKYSVLSLFGFRINEGISVPFKKRPTKPLEIYEFEGCPFCRKVREAVSVLDLDVTFYPCPRGGPTFRPKVKKLGGKEQFPYLIDPNNNGKSMYESNDIIQYLYENYGPIDNTDGEVPNSLSTSFFTTLSLSLVSLARFGKGSKFVENKYTPLKKKPIIYYGYEGSPFCKIVREKLVEYEIPHLQKSCARGSSKRQELLDRTGRFQVPYIEDPNTDVKLFESADIIAYLDSVYGLP